MVSKEFFAMAIKNAARIVPGIGSYQDKEKLRDLDKRLRNDIASILRKQAERINDLKSLLSQQHKLEPLNDLDRLTKKTNQLADTTQYAAYGFAPLFDQASVDIKRLEELYAFDKQLEQELIDKIDALVQTPQADFSTQARVVEISLIKLANGFEKRTSLLKQVS